jgi:hypothetical protein
VLALAVVAGCGATVVPTKQVSETQASIRAAQELGAERTPRAAVHLKMARDQAAQAQTLIAAGETGEAWYLLRRAEADADLAIALTRETDMRRKAMQAKAQIQELRESSD